MVGALPRPDAGRGVQNYPRAGTLLAGVFREADAQADPATKEALRYGHALMHGFEDVRERPLTTSNAEKVCTRIKGVEMTIHRVPGTALASDRTGEIIYTPPTGEPLLRDLLTNWKRFLHEAHD